jgi:hypothetical protein
MARQTPFPGSRVPGEETRVRLNIVGMQELMKSPEIRSELVTRMARVQGALPGSKLEVMESPTRLRVKVERGSDYDEANTGDLSRALDLAGGRRGTQVKSRKPKRGA